MRRSTIIFLSVALTVSLLLMACSGGAASSTAAATAKADSAAKDSVAKAAPAKKAVVVDRKSVV